MDELLADSVAAGLDDWTSAELVCVLIITELVEDSVAAGLED